jgi:tetratricopeptide (TPR) repeat protein
VRTLSLAVLLFVVSLVMLTFADLSERVYRARRWYIAAVMVTLAAIVVVLHTDLEIWPRLFLPLAVPLKVFAVLVLRIIRKRIAPIGSSYHLEPTGLEPRAFPAEAMHGRHVPSRAARRIIRLIALTVLFSTVAGFLYSRATTESGEAAHKALEKEIEMHSRSTQRQSGVLATLHDLAQFEEERARYIAATQRAAFLSWRAETSASDLAPAEVRALHGAADLAKAEVRALYGAAAYYEDPRNSESKTRQATLRLRDDRVLGVDGDPRFPQGFVRRMALERPAENHRESLALWDTFNLRSLASSENAAAFLATLTMFAVALCLFGQAFNTSRGLAAQALLLSGKCLVVLGVAYTLSTLATAVEPRLATLFRPSDIAAPTADCKLDNREALPHLSLAETQAARHYANAHAWLSDARSADDYRLAVTALSCVVALRPDSALAKLDFANAVERAGLAQTTETFLRPPAKDTLPWMKMRMEKALDELRSLTDGENDGRAPPRLLGNLGRYTLLLAIDSKDPPGIAKSVAYLRRAEERSRRGTASIDRARILLNLSLALQAAGKDTEAERYFKDALAIGTLNRRLAARTITDLEILQTHCAQIAANDQCAKLPDRVACATSGRGIISPSCGTNSTTTGTRGGRSPTSPARSRIAS